MPSREGVSVNVGVCVHDVGAEQVAFLKQWGSGHVYTPTFAPPSQTPQLLSACGLCLTLQPVGWWAGVSLLTLWVLVPSCMRNMPDS